MRVLAKRVLKAVGLLGPVRRVRHWARAPVRRKQARAMQRFYAPFVGEGDLCFDVGANLGNRTSVFLALGARVVAVDPQPMCIRHLRKTFRANPRVTIIGTALGAEEGTAQLRIPDGAHFVASLNEEWVKTMEQAERFPGVQWEQTVEVPVTTLDKLIDRHGLPRFCKVDVEGFEEQVFKGLTRPIPTVSYEFNDEFLGPALAVTARLDELGYDRFNVSIGESMVMLWPRWGTREQVDELLRNPAGRLGERFGDVYASFRPDCMAPEVA